MIKNNITNKGQIQIECASDMILGEEFTIVYATLQPRMYNLVLIKVRNVLLKKNVGRLDSSEMSI